MVVVNKLRLGQTLVSNAFIDEYLCKADGEFVKAYIMLLRQMENDEVSVPNIASALGVTEKEVVRALFYWEEQGLLSIELEDGKLVQLEVNSPAMDIDKPKPVDNTKEVEAPEKTDKPKETEIKKEENKLPREMTDMEFKQLIYVTEKFFGRTLTKTETGFLVWLRDELGFSVDVIEYLIEYCVDRGHTKQSYLKAVATGWKDAKVTTVEEARAQVKEFSEDAPKASKPVPKAHNFQERKTDLNELLAKELRNGTK